MPLILGTNSIKDTGYNVANSCRFNDGDSSYLSQSTSSSTGKIFTLSFWMKKSTDSSTGIIFIMSSDSVSHNYIEIATKSANGLDVQLKNGSGGTFLRRKLNRLFRDFSAWMHVCIRFDSTNGTAGNRLRIYVNGTQETDIDVDSTPDVPEDYVTDFNNSSTINIARNLNDSSYYDGYLAEMVLVDGSSLAPTSFGEFDEDSPTIWKPINVSGLTFGTNGFYLDFEDSGDLGDDESGQGNDFTETNLAATDQATDTPTNNFCTMNSNNAHGTVTFAEGNIQVNVANNTDNASGTFFVDKGKWYVELKYTAQGGSDDLIMFGIRPDTMDIFQDNLFNLTGTGQGLYYYGDSGNQRPANTSYGNGVDLNDILGVYIDLDNNKLYFAINGTVQASGAGIDIPTTSDYYTFSFTSGGQSDTAQVNFGGCPTYTISSGNADANGFGNFEYDPSAGTFDSASKDFYSMFTKNLAEFG